MRYMRLLSSEASLYSTSMRGGGGSMLGALPCPGCTDCGSCAPVRASPPAAGPALRPERGAGCTGAAPGGGSGYLLRSASSTDSITRHSAASRSRPNCGQCLTTCGGGRGEGGEWRDGMVASNTAHIHTRHTCHTFPQNIRLHESLHLCRGQHVYTSAEKKRSICAPPASLSPTSLPLPSPPPPLRTPSPTLLSPALPHSHGTAASSPFFVLVGL
eukprot:364493-Chlamydomonas_euryale.AAC.21